MNKIKVSVIIPVYNTEKFLEQCLNSIVNQTLKDIEIIIINDGSTDSSSDIINKFKQKYKNIIYLSQKNSGQGEARNKALEVCTGEYITFVDSDDFIDIRMIENLYREASKNEIDVLVFNLLPFYKESQINKLSNNNCIVNKIYNKNEILKKFFTSYDIEGFSCNKFIKKDIFKNNKIKYPLGMKYEDIPTMLDVIINSKRFGIVSYTPYYYRQRLDSTTNTYNLSNVRDYIKSFYMVKNVIKIKTNYYYEYEDYIDYHFFTRILNFYYNNYISLDNFEIKEFIKHTIDKTINKKILLNRNVKLKMKIKYIIYRINAIKLFFWLKKLSWKMKSLIK